MVWTCAEKIQWIFRTKDFECGNKQEPQRRFMGLMKEDIQRFGVTDLKL